MGRTKQRSQYISSLIYKECRKTETVEAKNVMEKMTGNEGRGKAKSDLCHAMDQNLNPEGILGHTQGF